MEKESHGLETNGDSLPAKPKAKSRQKAKIDLDQFTLKLEQFLTKLNEEPDQKEIQINKAANNSQYLPISFTQTSLDEIFLGLWNFELKSYQVIANEIVGTGILEVFHPIANVWIKRSGAAAVMIQQKSEKNGGTGRISNIDDKIKNTLVKDFPHLESELIKSAAKKLGKIFGRDLNRQHEDKYTPIYTEQAKTSIGLSAAIEKLSRVDNVELFRPIWDANPSLHGNVEFQKNYLYFLTRLKRKKT